jgi:hypothetical protein
MNVQQLQNERLLLFNAQLLELFPSTPKKRKENTEEYGRAVSLSHYRKGASFSQIFCTFFL